MHDNHIRTARLIRVIDGDTIVVDIKLGFDVFLKSQTIRLVGINAPERRGQTREKGNQAKKFLTDLLGQNRLSVRCNDWSKGTFGRWLCDVYVHNPAGGSLYVNGTMVNKGHALWDRR